MGRVSAAEWRERVEAWSASGETAEEFASEGQFDARQLSWWKWKFGREAPPRVPAFVPIRVVNSPISKARGAVEITFASGVRVRVPSGFAPRALAELIEAMGTLAC